MRQRLLSQTSSHTTASPAKKVMARHWSDFALAKSLAESGRYAEAIAPAERAVHLNPKSKAAAELRDQVLSALKSGEPHLVALELNSSLHPNDPEAFLTLGTAYSARNRPEDAERTFKRALTLGRDLEGHTELSVLYCELGRHEEARRHAEAALATAPTVDGLCGSMANEVLARVALAEGDTQAHAEFLRRAFADENMFHIAPFETPFDLVVLASQTAGNVPLNHLMPIEQFGRVLWYMEYASLQQVDRLPGKAVIFNAIGEPDTARTALDAVSELAPHLGGKILNPPARILATRRDRLSAVLQGIEHLWTPRTMRCPTSALTPDFLRKQFPGSEPVEFLVRPVGSHVGVGLQRVKCADDILLHDFGDAETVYVSQFWNGRHEDGLFRSYRVICIDRQVFPYHLAIGSDWMVHRHTTEMGARPEQVIEELAFLDDPVSAIGSKAYAALCLAAQKLDLDFVGIDFGISDAGEVVVFEANATMLVRPEAEDGLYADKSRHIAKIIRAFQDHLAAKAAA